MNPIFVAIDEMGVFEARELVDDLRGVIGGVKIGPTFWFRHGHSAVRHVAAGYELFIDMKFYDIPNQIDGAMRAIVAYRPFFVTIHVPPPSPDQEDDDAMMLAAMKAVHVEADRLTIRRPKILGVTALTSIKMSPADILARAYRAQRCGLDGVVCAASEARLLRSELNADFLIVSPGIRPVGSPARDHRRVATPSEAMEAGVNYMVIGEPITLASNPRQAAMDILASIESATV